MRGTAISVGLAVVVAALGPVSAAQASTSASSPHRGGNVTVLVLAVSPTIDPGINNLAAQSTDEPTVEAVYGPGLVYLNSNTDAVQMGFAQSLTTKDNGAVWTMVLHPGLKFSDGTSFNAAAVAYNVARLANPATGSTFQADAAHLSTKVLNATTLKITCKPADAVLPQIISQEFAMIGSPTAEAAEGANYGSHPVGPGPFQVQSFTYGISWTFVRNPFYARFAPGQPYLKTVEVLLAGTVQQTVTDLQTGVGQATEITGYPQAAQERAVGGITVVTPPQGDVGQLAFNASIPPFNNVLAREAVYDALSGAAVSGVWDPGNPVATNLFTPKSPFYNKKYDFPTQNTAKAQALFNQLAAAGTPLNFSILWPTSGSAGNVGAYVVGALSQFQNVTVTDNAVPLTTYHLDKASSGFQFTATSLPSVIPGAFGNFESNGGTNYGKWSDPKVDAALQTIQSTTNLAKQKQAWNTVQQEVNTQYPFIWAWDGVLGYSYNKSAVGGISTTEYGQVAFFGPMYAK